MKKKRLTLFLLLIATTFSAMLFSFPTYANCGDVETALIDCPTASGATPRYLAIDIINILSIGIGIVGVIGISLFGIQMMTSRDDPSLVAKARKRFFQILIGLAVYVLMWTGVNAFLPGGVILGRIAVEDVIVSPSIAEIAIGKTSKLIAGIYPLDADDQTVIWESSDESIATVDEYGNVTGHSIGEATIKATATNGSVSESTVFIIANDTNMPAYCQPSGGTDGSTTSTPASTAPSPETTSPSDTPYVNDLEIHFVSTGNDDDAILIRAQDKVIVIDGGRCTNGASCDSGIKFVNYMKTAGVTKIDALIGSHAHWNHIQAHSVIINNFPVGASYYPVDLNTCVKADLCESKDIKYVLDTLNEKNITQNFIDVSSSAQTLTIGNLQFFIIGPPRPRSGNKGSFVFIMQYGNKRFMFTGDQEWDGLSETKNGTNSALELLKSRAEALGTTIKADVFKWPHHGYNDKESVFADRKALFDEMGASSIVIPNSGSCGQTQVNEAVEKLGLKKYSNCGNTNLVITSNGNDIVFHERQSPENWVPQQTTGQASPGTGTSSTGSSSTTKPTSQACVSAGSATKTATGPEGATFINGNGCDDSIIFPGTKYQLSESQIKLVAHRVQKENCGSTIACKAEASQIVNLYEKKKPSEAHTTENFWKWFKETGWYSTAFSGLSASKAEERGISAVRDVIVNGNRTLPPNVAGHDTLEFNYPGHKYNIVSFFDSNGVKHKLEKSNVDQLIPGITKLTRRTASNKTFWCILRYENNEFGDPFTIGT